jgi:hypothetical protein
MPAAWPPVQPVVIGRRHDAGELTASSLRRASNTEAPKTELTNADFMATTFHPERPTSREYAARHGARRCGASPSTKPA